jgi:EAL domain-containing protein (putative c-di-GMP-specific phosphodiesterase class I)
MSISAADTVIIRAIIDLAHNLGLRTVAEGVEDADALSQLGVLGCDIAQGYHLARPMPAEAFRAWGDQKALTGATTAAPLRGPSSP